MSFFKIRPFGRKEISSSGYCFQQLLLHYRETCFVLQPSYLSVCTIHTLSPPQKKNTNVKMLCCVIGLFVEKHKRKETVLPS